jgi:hypothetical protein
LHFDLKPGIFIRSFFGWLLLVLFTFSITPRQLLHDVISDHTDLSVSTPGSKHAVVSKTGFNCDCLNLVAESPFTADEEVAENTAQHFCTDLIVHSAYKAFSKVITLPALRGPPEE